MAEFASNPALSYDEESEKNGVEVVFPPHPDFPDFGNCTVRVARAGGKNSAFDEALKAARRPFKHFFDTEKQTPEMQRTVFMQAIAFGCVRDYRWPDSAGNAMPFSKENALKLFKLDEFVYERCFAAAFESHAFTVAAKREAIEQAKNG